MANKFYNTPAFNEFACHLTNKSFSDGSQHFIRNLLCKYLDPVVTQSLSDPKNNAYFSNNLLTRQDQAKMFIGKIVGELYDKTPEIFPMPNKEDALKFFVGELNCVDKEKLNKTTNGKDIYTVLIDHYANLLSTLVSLGFSILYGPDKPTDETTCSQQLSKLVDSFNSIYILKSPNINVSLLDDSDSDTVDMNTDSDSDTDSDSPYIPPPPASTNKRKAEIDNTPNKKRKID